jgi:hypothetical protein
MTPPPEHEHAHELIRRVLGPAGPEVSCETCFEYLDECVEAELAGLDPDSVVPGMAAHLQGCPACQDDYESLRALLTSS